MPSKQTLTSGALSLISLISLISLSACDPTLNGQNGELTFSYDALGNEFSRPIAVGASLELNVSAQGSSAALSVQDVTLSDQAVFTATHSGDRRVTLKALGEGDSTVNVTAIDELGQTFDDSITMMAATPKTIMVNHPCLDEDEVAGYYLKGQEIGLKMTAVDKNNQKLVGVGGDFVELNAELVQLVSLNLSQEVLKLKLGDMEGEVELTSAYDANFKRVIKIVEPAKIDSITLEQGEAVVVDSGSFITVRPAIMGVSICRSTLPLTITTLTPEVCDVATVTDRLSEPDQPVDPAALGDSGWLDVQGKAVGDCKFTITYPQGADGAGVSAELTVAVTAP